MCVCGGGGGPWPIGETYRKLKNGGKHIEAILLATNIVGGVWDGENGVHGRNLSRTTGLQLALRPVVRKSAHECIVGAREFETEATAEYASDAQCFWCRGIIPAAWVRDAIETERGVCASRVPVWC